MKRFGILGVSVRECAHQVQLVLDRYRNPHLVGPALELVNAHLLESILY